MKKFIVLCFAMCLCFTGFQVGEVQADELPACDLSGDMDQDGVLDEDDSDELDSCEDSSTGLEDCESGQGDGEPDCEEVE